MVNVCRTCEHSVASHESVTSPFNPGVCWSCFYEQESQLTGNTRLKWRGVYSKGVRHPFNPKERE